MVPEKNIRYMSVCICLINNFNLTLGKKLLSFTKLTQYFFISDWHCGSYDLTVVCMKLLMFSPLLSGRNNKQIKLHNSRF